MSDEEKNKKVEDAALALAISAMTPEERAQKCKHGNGPDCHECRKRPGYYKNYTSQYKPPTP